MGRTAMGSRLGSIGLLIGNRWLALWFLANGIAQIGHRVYLLAIPWLVMTMTGSAMYMNAVWAVEMLPFLVAGPFMGVLIDRFDRRRTMIVSNIAQAALVGAIPLLHFTGQLQIWHLFVTGFLLNCFSLAYNLVGDFGVIPRLARGAELALANSIHFTILNLSMVFGSAVGGALINWMSAPGSLLFTAVSLLGTTVVVTLLPVDLGSATQAGRATVRAVFGDVAEGFRFLWRDGLIRNLALGLCISNLALGALTTTATYHLGQEWGLDADQVGLAFSVIGLTAVGGSLAAPVLIRRFPIGRAVVAWNLAEALGVGIAALSGHWTIAVAGLAVQALAGTLGNISTFTIRQKVIPNAFMGRVNAAFRMVLTLSFPLSAVLLGAVTERAGARPAFGTAGAICVLAALVLLLSPVGRYALPQDAEQAV